MRLDKNRIIGVDPGTNILGFAIIDYSLSKPKVLTADVLRLKDFELHADKLREIYLRVQEIIEAYGPAIMSIETPFYGKNPQSMLKLGRAQGVALTAAVVMGLDLYEFSPKKIKQSITGNGNASKQQVFDMLQKTTQFKIEVKYLDASDALATALCCYYFLQNPLPTKSGKSSWASYIKEFPDKIKN